MPKVRCQKWQLKEKATAVKSLKACEEALRKAMGNITVAAKALGMNRTALQQRVTRYPQLQAIVQEFRDALCDHAESALVRAVLAGEAWATCFTLKCQGKSRGYVERVEQAIVEPVRLEIVEEIVSVQPPAEIVQAPSPGATGNGAENG